MLTGLHQTGLPHEAPDLTFRYQVDRLWQAPVERFLTGPLGLVPLAPLAAVSAGGLPEVVRRLERRIEQEAPALEGEGLKIVTFTLLGLRVPLSVAGQLMPGVRAMRDSTTYQAILDEGRAEGEARGRAIGQIEGRKSALLQLGERRFGPPDPRSRARLEALDDLEEIARLTDRLLDAESWELLLQGS